ncbi:MAG: hypothetical protein KKD98_02500, partial [Candidatus Thermoplasmatota archaeon]|nr:hypothetical protein [Candidatus Thermoplasmatota archaeon]
MHKKIAALWVCGLMVISALLIAYSPVTMTAIGAGGTFGGGDGTPGNPYLIEDVLDLQAMNNNKDAHYALASDIDASDTVNWNGGAGFIPIGTDANWFTGSLDGQNFTVTNLYMNHTNINYIGLFGFIGTGSIVKNLHVFELNITGGNYVGGIAGYSMGTIYNAHTSGRIAGLDYVGGLLGQNENGHLNCSHTSIIFHGTHNYVGGLVGNNNGASSIIFGSSVAEKVNGYYNVGGITGNNDYGTIMNSYAAETVVGHQRVGGLVGRNTGVVLNSYALGNTNGTGYVGGLIGDNMIGSVSNSYSWGKVTRTSLLNLNLGAFVGRNYMGMIVNCYSTGSVQYANAADPVDKGFVANVNTGGSYNMTGNFWDIETSGQASTYGNATGKTTAEMKTQSTFTNASWDFANIWWMIENDTYPLLRWMDTEPPASPADLTVVHQGDILFQEALTNCIFMNNYSSWTLTRIQNQGASVWDVAQTATADGSGSATSSLSVNTRNTARAEEAVWTQTFTGISGNITVNAAYRVQTA